MILYLVRGPEPFDFAIALAPHPTKAALLAPFPTIKSIVEVDLTEARCIAHAEDLGFREIQLGIEDEIHNLSLGD